MNFGDHETKVVQSIFTDISTTENGGALRLTNSIVKIYCCEFEKWIAKAYGGAILLNKAKSNLTNLYFQTCFVQEHKDSNYGNCGYIKDCETHCEIISAHKCGSSSDKCGDSTLVFDQNVTFLKYLNSTKSFSYFGASGFTMISSRDGSTASHILCSECGDYTYAELFYVSHEFSFCNFINGQSHESVFYVYGAGPTIKDSVFVNTPLLLNGGTGTVDLKNCQSNVAYAGYQLKTFVGTIDFHVISSCDQEIKCITRPNNFYDVIVFRYLLFNILFLFLTKT